MRPPTPFRRERSDDSSSRDAIVVVGKGGVNRLILARALGLDLRHMFRLQQTCGAACLIDYYGDQAVVQVMNATWMGASACWTTVEEPEDVASAIVHARRADVPVIVDCVTVWICNLLWQHRDATAQDTSLRS